MTANVFDLLVIGGGINGAGIARDAAGRGLKVLLCERDDLGQHTSSASTKLIHGGLRYLETYEFRLVREALAERERLMRLAPHIIRPLRFVLPQDDGLRPAWLLRLGLFLYDHLTPLRALPVSTGMTFSGRDPANPLQQRLKRGFAYSDCWVDDSRLVVLNARDAAERGATIRPRTCVESARRHGGAWVATIRDTVTGGSETVRARILVNAAGPWVGETLTHTLGLAARAKLRLVKGSHIVVPRLYDGAQAYILQQPDRRIVFVIPYERDFTLIGTTEVAFDGATVPVSISADETQYLCECVNRSFKRAVSPQDVVWSYSGLRPLFDDASTTASAVTREYVLSLDESGEGAPALSVFGGKITTYRRLAEQVLARLARFLPKLAPRWTDGVALPGGDFGAIGFDGFQREFEKRYPFLKPETTLRMARAYGTRADDVLGNATNLSDIGECYGADLSRREVDYLVRTEWARMPDDILWRRSKLGLRIGHEDAARLAAHLSAGQMA